MIIKASRIKTSSGARALCNHVFRGDENEAIQILYGDEEQVREIFRDTTASGHKYAVRHIKISPENYSRKTLKAAVYKLAEEFGFNPHDAVLVEHRKARANGSEGACYHAHMLVSELQRGKALSNSHMRARHEKIARLLELETGERLRQGRHNRAVYEALVKEGKDDAAIAIAHLAQDPAVTCSYSSDQHQIAKRCGIDLPKTQAAMKATISSVCPEDPLARLHAVFNVADEQGVKIAVDPSARFLVIQSPSGKTLGSLERIGGIERTEMQRLLKCLRDLYISSQGNQLDQSENDVERRALKY
ncbi:MAG: relaxase/mobilization nuclease domain-containing protein [Roseinatronobacter sp.]